MAAVAISTEPIPGQFFLRQFNKVKGQNWFKLLTYHTVSVFNVNKVKQCFNEHTVDTIGHAGLENISEIAISYHSPFLKGTVSNLFGSKNSTWAPYDQAKTVSRNLSFS